MIGDNTYEKALHFLAETDEEAAKEKVRAMELEDEIKATKAAVFQRVEGSVEARKAMAETHENVTATRKLYYDALLKWEHRANKRRTAERIIECWRSEQANRRQG